MTIDIQNEQIISINFPDGSSASIGLWNKLISVNYDVHIDNEVVMNTESDLHLQTGTICTSHKKQINKANGYCVLIDTSIYRRKG